MSKEHELEDFDSLFESLDLELNSDPDPIDDDDKAKEKTPVNTEIFAPKSEDDFLNAFEGVEDDDDEDEEKDEKTDKPDPNPKPKEDEEGEDNDNDNEEDEASSYFEAVGKGLYKLGKFGEVPADFKWTEESFLEKFEELSEANSKQKITEMLTDKWGEIGVEMFDDIFIKKVPIKEYLTAYGEAEDFSKIDLDLPASQKLVVKSYLEKMGVDEDEIFEQIELLEEKGKLLDRAEKYKEKLIEDRLAEMQEIAAKRDAAIQAQKKQEADRKAAINAALTEALKAKEVNGIPLSTNDGKDLLQFVTAPAYKLQSGQEITEFDKRILDIKKDPKKLLALGKLLKEDLNVTPIKNKAADETKTQVFDFVKTGKSPKKGEVLSQIDLLFGRSKK